MEAEDSERYVIADSMRRDENKSRTEFGLSETLVLFAQNRAWLQRVCDFWKNGNWVFVWTKVLVLPGGSHVRRSTRQHPCGSSCRGWCVEFCRSCADAARSPDADAATTRPTATRRRCTVWRRTVWRHICHDTRRCSVRHIFHDTGCCCTWKCSVLRYYCTWYIQHSRPHLRDQFRGNAGAAWRGATFCAAPAAPTVCATRAAANGTVVRSTCGLFPPIGIIVSRVGSSSGRTAWSAAVFLPWCSSSVLGRGWSPVLDGGRPATGVRGAFEFACGHEPAGRIDGGDAVVSEWPAGHDAALSALLSERGDGAAGIVSVRRGSSGGIRPRTQWRLSTRTARDCPRSVPATTQQQRGLVVPSCPRWRLRLPGRPTSSSPAPSCQRFEIRPSRSRAEGNRENCAKAYPTAESRVPPARHREPEGGSDPTTPREQNQGLDAFHRRSEEGESRFEDKLAGPQADSGLYAVTKSRSVDGKGSMIHEKFTRSHAESVRS